MCPRNCGGSRLTRQSLEPWGGAGGQKPTFIRTVCVQSLCPVSRRRLYHVIAPLLCAVELADVCVRACACAGWPGCLYACTCASGCVCVCLYSVLYFTCPSTCSNFMLKSIVCHSCQQPLFETEVCLGESVCFRLAAAVPSCARACKGPTWGHNWNLER